MQDRVLSDAERADLAAGYQLAVVNHLRQNVLRALKHCRNNKIAIRHFVVSGGVARNKSVREWCAYFIFNLVSFFIHFRYFLNVFCF